MCGPKTHLRANKRTVIRSRDLKLTNKVVRLPKRKLVGNSRWQTDSIGGTLRTGSYSNIDMLDVINIINMPDFCQFLLISRDFSFQRGARWRKVYFKWRVVTICKDVGWTIQKLGTQQDSKTVLNKQQLKRGQSEIQLPMISENWVYNSGNQNKQSNHGPLKSSTGQTH